jgi:hypothetical protein
MIDMMFIQSLSFIVIPGRREAAGPESISTIFRVVLPAFAILSDNNPLDP